MSEIKPVYTCDMQSVSDSASSSSSQQPEQLIDESVFEHHFQEPSADGNIVHDVTLNHEEQQILLRKMNDFEIYKALLSKEEKAELEKNKYSLVDFSYKSEKLGKDYKTYSEFQNFYSNLEVRLKNALKTGKTTTLTNEELAQVLHYTDTTDLVSDGKIGSTAQGTSPDCWFLSQLNNYNQTEDGRQNISDRIEENKDGSYTVTFQNPLSQDKQIQYIITKDELKNFGLNTDKKIFGTYSSGDIDTRIYEIATSKMLKDFVKDKIPLYAKVWNLFRGIKQNVDNTMGGGSLRKRLLVHKAMGYSGDITTYQTNIANDKFNFLRFFANTKNKEEKAAFDKYIHSTDAVLAFTATIDENGEVKTTFKLEPKCKNLSDVIKNHPEYKAENLTCNSEPSKYKPGDLVAKNNRYLQGGHVFNISNIDNENNSIILQDPYVSAFPFAITQERFTYTDDTKGHGFVRLTYLPSKIKYPCK